jgi:protein-S-isoprenylcysteine O-methyltransferase Ste14
MSIQPDGFSARGGWWVAVQLPLLLLAYLVPTWTGRAPSFAQLDLVAAAGLALLIAGALLFAAAASALGRALTPFPRPVAGGALRTHGVYAWVRHPIYAGVLCMSLGWSLYQHSLVGVAFTALLFAFFDRKAAREETWLAEVYPAYAAYRRRVKRLIPGLY